MKSLYDVDKEAASIQRKKRTHLILLISLACATLTADVLLLTLIPKAWSYVLGALLTTAYFWYLFTYFYMVRRELNASYHLLAEVQQFEHREVGGTILSLGEPMTYKKIVCREISLSEGESLYGEAKRVPSSLQKGQRCRFEVVDGFIVAYEEETHE